MKIHKKKSKIVTDMAGNNATCHLWGLYNKARLHKKISFERYVAKSVYMNIPLPDLKINWIKIAL